MRIAIAQIEIRMGDKKWNVKNTLHAIEEAGRAGADVCLLPECALSGWLSSRARQHAETYSGETILQWRHRAKKIRMNIIAGFEELHGDKVFNSAILINRSGKIVSVHRKFNELNLARATYSCGTELRLTEIDSYPVGINICADNWTPESAAVLFQMGAKILFSPCAWAVSPGAETKNLSWISARYRQVIRKSPLWIIAANSVGSITEGIWKGKILQGNSLAYDPSGRRLFKASSEPGLFHLEIPL